MLLTKKEIWKKIKDRDFSFPLRTELYSIIEKNFSRVDFIKDQVGIRDFLFLAEEGTPFTADFFVAINVECEKSYSYKKNLFLYLNKYNDSAIPALKELESFFYETNRTLYIGIGFKETAEYNQEEFVEELLTGTFETQEEIFKKLRKFPDWFEIYAKNPEELKYLTVKSERYINEVLKPLEKVKLREKLNNLLEKEDLSLNDKEILKLLTIQLVN